MRTKKMVEAMHEDVKRLSQSHEASRKANSEGSKQFFDMITDLKGEVISLKALLSLYLEPNATVKNATVVTSGRTIPAKRKPKPKATPKIKEGRKNGRRGTKGVPIDTLKLKTLMKYRGLRVKDLASASGLNAAMIYRYLTGKVLPTIQSLLKLSESLGVPASHLRAG